jgi:hypothetical protein
MFPFAWLSTLCDVLRGTFIIYLYSVCIKGAYLFGQISFVTLQTVCVAVANTVIAAVQIYHESGPTH